MKIAITGHTSGLGKSLSEVFPDYLGFSRSNGFDLHFADKRAEMISQIGDCDVFINNSPIGWNQTSLLYELWAEWQDKARIIINVGSTASDYNHPYPRPYTMHKKALEGASLQLQQSNKPCKVLLIKPGYIDTPRVDSIDAIKMNSDELAKFIKMLVEQKYLTFWIPTITIYPK